MEEVLSCKDQNLSYRAKFWSLRETKFSWVSQEFYSSYNAVQKSAKDNYIQNKQKRLSKLKEKIESNYISTSIISH